jgi:hypothetical protein
MNTHQQFDQFAERNFVFPEGNIDFFLRKINDRLNDSLIQAVQVFQQPNARGTMNFRDKKTNLRDATFRKSKDFGFEFFEIEKRVGFIRWKFLFLDANTRHLLNLVVLFELIGI